MGCLRFRPLIGIVFDGMEKELAPVSSDVFISIPDRDYLFHLLRVSLHLVPEYQILSTIISYDVFNQLNKS
jgi:hypothetical protein